jgi:hypothetical protein
MFDEVEDDVEDDVEDEIEVAKVEVVSDVVVSWH